MLSSYLHIGTIKRSYSTEPFIDNHGQRILITGGTWFTLDLLRSHIENGAGSRITRTGLTHTLGKDTLHNESNTKITE